MVTGVDIKQVMRLLLLPCLLLMAQSLALAHDFDHQAAEDGSRCVICPVGSNVETGAVDCGETQLLESPAALTSYAPDTVRLDSFRIFAVARAPPASI